jgi:hypothetical protein
MQVKEDRVDATIRLPFAFDQFGDRHSNSAYGNPFLVFGIDAGVALQKHTRLPKNSRPLVLHFSLKDKTNHTKAISVFRVGAGAGAVSFFEYSEKQHGSLPFPFFSACAGCWI